MERVAGIGGLFFRANDPKALAQWYEDHLGIEQAPESYETSSWWQQPGPTVFAPFEADSEHFGRPEQTWSVNFRVHDLDAMVAQLRAAGIDVEVDPEVYPNGRFATLHDPEQNPLQLWQPDGADRRGPAND
ncbi:VOC family protein [Kribbella sp. CA-294648]|uniref:VOC family protein n=1 Tax=Kribbella sp. CA-294648 TaxID=3239948 RepID=UPI003D8D5F84